MNTPGAKNEYLVAELNLYAFALTPGSGKTFNSKKHPSIIDMDIAVDYTITLTKLMENKQWEKVREIKTASLKKYIKANYADKPMSTNNLILLVTTPKEAECMDATLLGYYKISYNKALEIRSNLEWWEDSWTVAEDAEIKTHKEIETIILKAATKYL